MNGIGSVWEEKRPPYQAKTKLSTETTAVYEEANVLSASSDRLESAAALDGGDTSVETVTGGGSVVTSSATATSINLPLWLSGDDQEHASGRHGGTAEFTGSLRRAARQLCNAAQ